MRIKKKRKEDKIEIHGKTIGEAVVFRKIARAGFLIE